MIILRIHRLYETPDPLQEFFDLHRIKLQHCICLSHRKTDYTFYNNLCEKPKPLTQQKKSRHKENGTASDGNHSSWQGNDTKWRNKLNCIKSDIINMCTHTFWHCSTNINPSMPAYIVVVCTYAFHQLIENMKERDETLFCDLPGESSSRPILFNQWFLLFLFLLKCSGGTGNLIDSFALYVLEWSCQPCNKFADTSW